MHQALYLHSASPFWLCRLPGLRCDLPRRASNSPSRKDGVLVQVNEGREADLGEYWRQRRCATCAPGLELIMRDYNQCWIQHGES